MTAGVHDTGFLAIEFGFFFGRKRQRVSFRNRESIHVGAQCYDGSRLIGF
jgi:hypothetical protein